MERISGGERGSAGVNQKVSIPQCCMFSFSYSELYSTGDMVMTNYLFDPVNQPYNDDGCAVSSAENVCVLVHGADYTIVFLSIDQQHIN